MERTELMWAVIAECRCKNDGRDFVFEREIARFQNPINAEDFINMCLPQENRKAFKIKRIES